MTPADGGGFRFRGRVLTLARVSWVAVALPTIAILMLAAARDRSVMGALAGSGWTPGSYRAALAQARLRAATLEVIYILSANLVRLGFVGVCLVLFRRSADGMAFFASLTLLTFSITAAGVSGLPTGEPALAAGITLLQAVGQGCIFLFIFVFPNGHFVPGWMRWPTLVAVLGLSLISRLPGVRVTPAGLAFLWLTTLWLIIGVLPAQIYRYWRVSTSIERQQTKLVVFGIAIFLFGTAGGWLAASYILPTLAPAFIPAPGTGARLMVDFAFIELGRLPTLALPLTLGVAILRYRLWDIDVIIRRTLIYALLTGLLALAYFGSVLVLQNVFSALTGQSQSTLVTVLSTLGIAALFVPLRARVQAVIDQRLYRGKYDAGRTLAAFGASVRDETNLDQLTAHLMDVVNETIHPTTVSLWLNGDARER